MKRSTTALIKDLELQLDYLIGYAPQGLHWKREYHFREELINNTLLSDSTPQETIDKIAHIQGTLHDMRQKLPKFQAYISDEPDHEFLINDYREELQPVKYALDPQFMDRRIWKQFDTTMIPEQQITMYEYPKQMTGNL